MQTRVPVGIDVTWVGQLVVAVRESGQRGYT
jgi:hypothetical protein